MMKVSHKILLRFESKDKKEINLENDHLECKNSKVKELSLGVDDTIFALNEESSIDGINDLKVILNEEIKSKFGTHAKISEKVHKWVIAPNCENYPLQNKVSLITDFVSNLLSNNKIIEKVKILIRYGKYFKAVYKDYGYKDKGLLIFESPFHLVNIGIYGKEKNKNNVDMFATLAKYGNYDIKEILKDIKFIVDYILSTISGNLKGVNLKPGKYSVILDSSISQILIHECMHFMEADLSTKEGTIWGPNMIGRKVTSEDISIMDTCKSRFFGYLPFDDEGTIGKPIYLIKNGILNAFLSDLKYSKALNKNPTGNARSDSVYHKPLIRMRVVQILSDKKYNAFDIDNGIFFKGGAKINP